MTIALTLNQIGARKIGQAAMGIGGSEVYAALHLFVNDAFPGWSEDGSELTECTNAGYAPVAPAWGAAAETDPGDRLQFAAAAVTITFAAYGGADVVIYGGYTTNGGGDVCMVGRMSTPFLIPHAGGTLIVRPVYQSVATAP